MEPLFVKVTVTATPREQSLSGCVTLSVELNAPVGSVSRIEWPRELLDAVTSRTWSSIPGEIAGPVQQAFSMTETWRCTAKLEPFVIGPDQMLRFNPLMVWMKGEVQPRQVDMEPVLVTITSRLTADRKLIHPPTDYDDSPLSHGSISSTWGIIFVLAGLLAVLVGLIILRKLRPRQRAVTPIDQLLSKLDGVRVSDLTTTLPPLLREYVHISTGINAVSHTVEELQQALAGRSDLPQQISQALILLKHLELYQFSATTCDHDEALSLLRQTHELITASRVNHS